MTDLENAMVLLVKCFYSYSGKEGDPFTLTKGELSQMFRKEISNIKDADKSKLDEIFKDLDNNKDGTVDFQEYLVLVAVLCMATNDFFKAALDK